MGLEILESFDHYDHNDRRLKWPVTTRSAMEISASYGRNGAGARITTGGSFLFTVAGQDVGGFGADSFIFEKYFSSSTQWNVGMAFKIIEEENSETRPLIALLDRGTTISHFGTLYETQCGLLMGSSQRLAFYVGDLFVSDGFVISDGSPPLKRGTFNYIEIAVVLGASGSVQLKLNGKVVISETGLATSFNGGGASGVRIFHHKTFVQFGAGTRSFIVDDIYVTSGGTGMSDVKIEADLPTADGAVRQWTPSIGGTLNFPNVDDVAPNENTDYNTGSVGNIDTYAMSNLSTTAGTVHGVTLNADSTNADFDTATISGVVRQGGVNHVSSASTVGTITYDARVFGYLTNPATGNKFTISEVNSDEFGVERTS